MPRPEALPDQPGQPDQPASPFDPLAAHRLRTALGMGPEHVARDMRVSYGLPYVGPDLVLAWERGEALPAAAELTALAGALWCAPTDLVARPRTLLEHRVARGLPPEEVARATGVDPRSYLRMEERQAWRGTDRQSTALAGLLGLSLPDLVTVAGNEERLTELLRAAVTGRRPGGQTRAISKLVPLLDRGVLEDVLVELHAEYQARLATPLGRELRDRVLEYFWSAVEKETGEAP
ncbi:helix-turn-helix transcriptional regulator [Streptomyces sp. NPDC023723]|uniref:helix-turn-helix domain-containing protein n=1 Tax=Streptomyces sp. NPDC023723 TaxID=3154323 RepID=UPI0033E0CFC1